MHRGEIDGAGRGINEDSVTALARLKLLDLISALVMEVALTVSARKVEETPMALVVEQTAIAEILGNVGVVPKGYNGLTGSC